jgi:hypothetical protein
MIIGQNVIRNYVLVDRVFRVGEILELGFKHDEHKISEYEYIKCGSVTMRQLSCNIHTGDGIFTDISILDF